MKVANAATVTGREPLPYSTPAPVDLPTEARTQDVEAWRQDIAERREQQATLRQMASTSREAEYARPAAPPEPVREDEPLLEPAPRPAPAPIQDRIDAARPAPAKAPAPAPSPQPEAPGGARQPRRAMSSAEVATAVQSYLDGSTIPEISGALGRGTRTIRQALLGAGVQLRDDRAGHSGGRPKAPSDDDPALVAQVRRLYVDEGRNQDDVARALGVSRKAVQGIMARHEIPARPSARDLSSLRQDGALALRARMDAAGITAADVRAWARATGREVPLRGVPSAALVDAYLTALEAPGEPAGDVVENAPEVVDAATQLHAHEPGTPEVDEPLDVEDLTPAVADVRSTAAEVATVTDRAIDPESIRTSFAEYQRERALIFPGAPEEPAVPALDELVDAALLPVIHDVLAALQDVVQTTTQLLQAQQTVAAYRIRRLQALTGELLAVLAVPVPTTGG